MNPSQVSVVQPATVEIVSQDRFNASTVNRCMPHKPNRNSLLTVDAQLYHVKIRSHAGVTDVRNKVYAEFEVLHHRMKKHPGIGTIPPKKGTGDKKARIAEISRGFTSLLNQLLSRPDTAGDPELCKFLHLDSSITTYGLTGDTDSQQPQDQFDNNQNQYIQQQDISSQPAQPHPVQPGQPSMNYQQQSLSLAPQPDMNVGQPLKAMAPPNNLEEAALDLPAAPPPGLEGYFMTETPQVPPGYEQYSIVESFDNAETTPVPAGYSQTSHDTPEVPARTTEAFQHAQFSPTPVPAAMTPEQPPQSMETFSPTPLPHAQTPPVPQNTAVQAGKPSAFQGNIPSQVEIKKSHSERKLSPDAVEGQYAGNDEQIACAWIKDLIGQDCSSGSLQEKLKDGVILCELINRIRPNTIKKINKSTMPFPQRENIKAFCDAARELGVPDQDNFTTADLFDDKNFKQVLRGVFSLSRQCYYVDGYSGPCIGRPELARTGSLKETSKFGEVKGDALWGKANAAFTAADGRPSGAVAANNSKAQFFSSMRP